MYFSAAYAIMSQPSLLFYTLTIATHKVSNYQISTVWCVLNVSLNCSTLSLEDQHSVDVGPIVKYISFFGMLTNVKMLCRRVGDWEGARSNPKRDAGSRDKLAGSGVWLLARHSLPGHTPWPHHLGTHQEHQVRIVSFKRQCPLKILIETEQNSLSSKSLDCYPTSLKFSVICITRKFLRKWCYSHSEMYCHYSLSYKFFMRHNFCLMANVCLAGCWEKRTSVQMLKIIFEFF